MSFSTDPYNHLDATQRLTREAIKLLKGLHLKVAILTKGGLRACRDFDLLDDEDWFGVTLTLTDESQRLRWEKDAAPTAERILSLEKAKDAGLKTWVSLEPVIDPVQTLDLIDRTYALVDLYKVGTLNYVDLGTDWACFAQDAVTRLESHNACYYLKADLRKWLQ